MKRLVLLLLALTAAAACSQTPPPKVCDPDQGAPHKKDDAVPFGFCPTDAPRDAGVDAPIADAADAG